MMDKTKISTFADFNPMIYAYTTPGVTYHDGWTKIGYTTRDVDERIKEQTHTAGIRYNLEWQSEARYKDDGAAFSDSDFHNFLTIHHNIKREPSTEWFEIAPSRAEEYFQKFRSKDFGKLNDKPGKDYILRSEQQEAVNKTLEYFKSGKTPREFLWNAKPRFGKTLTTYDFIRQVNAKKVLIITNRPSIANSWFDDFKTYIEWQTDYYFFSESKELAGRAHTHDEFVSSIGESDGRIEFESLQNLKSAKCLVYPKRYDVYDKLEWIPEVEWDLIVIDEAHEGVETELTELILSHIKHKPFILYLSGTPFKALASQKFNTEQIFNWSYEDEQQAKANWDKHSESANPYEDLPRLNMFTYQLSQMIIDKASKGIDLSEDENAEYAFDLNEFFRANDDETFVYEKDVRKFLDALTDRNHEKFPFSTPTLRNELPHTLWMFNRVNSVKAMAKLLKEHAVFENYEIIDAVGDEENLERVREAIKTHSKTITLSVRQLTTGVTIPEWTGVLMLSNMQSAAAYMQAAFRAQNPYQFVKGDQIYRKANCYVFDFAPERTLIILEEFANNLKSSTAGGSGTKEEHKENVRQLLNFLPVIAEDEEGKMIELDAAKVLTLPIKIKTKEVIHRGFMSNFLFANIGNIFSAPLPVREILNKIEAEYEQGENTRTKQTAGAMDKADDVAVDGKGNVTIDNKHIISQTKAIFGEKVYDKAKVASETAKNVKKFADEDTDTLVSKSLDTINKTVMTADVEKRIKETYKTDDKNIKPNVLLDKAQKSLNKENEKVLKNIVADFERQKKSIAKEEDEQVQAEQLSAAKENFEKNLNQAVQNLIEESQEKVIPKIETIKEEIKKDRVEDDVRAHLRGFARTIPSFIMAYSDEAHHNGRDLHLSNFDEYPSDEVFVEVTSITKKEFRFLRDGGDYTDTKTGETLHFNGHLFDEIVFDEAVQEFLNLKEALGDYFDEGREEDIFDYIPPQKTNQIFTPREAVIQMVNAAELETPGLFDNPEQKFIDLYIKSGLYITEIVKRLFRSEKMKELYPNRHERLKHILENQVYGCAPTEIIYKIALAYIFGAADEMADIAKDNFIFADTSPHIKAGTLSDFLNKNFSK